MAATDEGGSKAIGRRRWLAAVALAGALGALPGEAPAQGWPGYGRDPQHSSLAHGGSQVPQKARWSTPVDLSEAGNTGTIYIHYGSPVITRFNTVLVPVKTTAAGNYRVEARSGATGKVLWTSPLSDYALPAHDWVPIFGITLTPGDLFVVYPGAGGTIYARGLPDLAAGRTLQLAFYDKPTGELYKKDPAAFNAAIQICTPISSDGEGSVYFGYTSTGAPLPGYPNGIPGGLAKVSADGVGRFVAASALAGDGSIQKVAYNGSPAFSHDGSTAYVAVNNGSTGKGYLCAVDAHTLAPRASVPLDDPRFPAASPQPAFVDDDGSATPSVGPDGDVYYGVLAAGISGNHYRGFLLHFDATLTTSKLPGAFGWDDTASIVPASAVPSYGGASPYLLLTKYNNYVEGGGTGVNQLALLDPNAAMVDPISGATVMQPVLTIAGVTPDPEFPNTPGAVREWCINSAAIDPVNRCAVVNSEDGHVYRWDFVANKLSAGLSLEPSTSEAYTPTVIGPDGAVYAINNAVLFSCIAK